MYTYTTLALSWLCLLESCLKTAEYLFLIQLLQNFMKSKLDALYQKLKKNDVPIEMAELLTKN